MKNVHPIRINEHTHILYIQCIYNNLYKYTHTYIYRPRFDKPQSIYLIIPPKETPKAQPGSLQARDGRHFRPAARGDDRFAEAQQALSDAELVGAHEGRLKPGVNVGGHRLSSPKYVSILSILSVLSIYL